MISQGVFLFIYHHQNDDDFVDILFKNQDFLREIKGMATDYHFMIDFISIDGNREELGFSHQNPLGKLIERRVYQERPRKEYTR